MALNFDICIRGCGIAGRTLALLLANQRLRVALVQTAPSFQTEAHSDVRAYALNSGSRQLLQSLRCWPEGQAMTPVLHMQVLGDHGGELHFRASEQGVEALNWMVDVSALEERLASAVNFQPLIETFGPEAIDQVQAPLTVICEGRASLTRAELGVVFDVKAYDQHALATRVHCALPHQQTACQWFQSGASQSQADILALLPIGGAYGQEVAVVWSAPAAKAAALLAMTESDFVQALEAACHHTLGPMRLSGPRAVWPLQLAHASRWAGAMPGQPSHSFVLAGDAAHTMHPLAGQGMNVGLADIAELAKVLGEREFWRPLNDMKLLRRYERARQADVKTMGWATDQLQNLFAQPGAPWQPLRNWGLSAFDKLGPLKRWATENAMQ
jgi:ubiquinone biosynthesis UbiH/UbiF/VisC/COQ6 family hydroxylase